MPAGVVAPPAFTIATGRAEIEIPAFGPPVLAGESTEPIFKTSRALGRSDRVALFERDDWRLGVITAPVADGLEAVTLQLYREIFAAIPGLHLARVWNYVPAINATGPGHLENYRLFCRGRSVAFEQQHGADFARFLPSASAVGGPEHALTVVFAACAAAPQHVENPAQIPAYEYPPEHGPRPPSFARATIVPGAAGATIFVSGTSAIRGHATMAPHDTARQLDCTLENLREISRACGLGSDLAAGRRRLRHFKIYLRHASDQPVVAATLAACLLQPGDTFSYLHAGICRAELNVEIEATLQPAA
ncbi:MAG TPA: hypothetical protein VHD62_04525 [Opitutaceae bacterium]|nr:hypothetical protein [Opitutaceae bacterium]